nr:MAG TPA: Cytochrome c oxidase subunit VIc [Caudoviricetes sp.]
MSQQAVFFKNYDPMEELKISVDGTKIRIRVNDSPCFGIALSPDMAREAARILNIYAIIAEAEAEQFQRNHKQALQKDTK